VGSRTCKRSAGWLTLVEVANWQALISSEEHDLFLCPCLEICYFKGKFAEQFAGFTGTDRIHIGNPGAFYFDNISAGDVILFLSKQMYGSLLFLSETMDILCLAGSAQQTQQSTHLAEGLPIVT